MKIRPAVVLSTELYHRYRPDVIVGLITTRKNSFRQIANCAIGGRRDYISRPSSGYSPSHCCSGKYA